MDPERWRRIEEIFNECRELPEAQREAYIQASCDGDAEVEAEVRVMLNNHTLQLLDAPVVPLPPELPEESDQVGDYELIEKLDAGGFGQVYLARDQTVEKDVALKVIRPDRLNPLTLRLFHDERKILGKLEHANIAHIFGGGATETGLPYYVMQYVEGTHLDEYCAVKALDVRQRLDLFRQICLAVHYAHSKTVVHRDLKPSNILVTDDGTPMLLDFGVARLLERRIGPAGDESLADPSSGATMPLTLAYASPEQVRSGDVTTESDVYSLGVILYLLLTGCSPYRNTPTALALSEAIQQQIPQKPSTVAPSPLAYRADPDETTATLPKDSLIRLGFLRQEPSEIDADVDCIAMKALQKDPDQRYNSAGSLADDIEKYLGGFPVNANPLTPLQSARRYARREKAKVAVTLTMTVLIFFGISMLAMVWQEQQVTSSMLEFFRWLENPDGKTLRETLNAVSDDDRIAELFNDRAGSLEGIGDFVTAEVLYKEALRMKLRLVNCGDEEIAVALDKLTGPNEAMTMSLGELAAKLAAQGKYDEAYALYRSSVSMKIRLPMSCGSESIAIALNNLAANLAEQGRNYKAYVLYRESLFMRIQLHGWRDLRNAKAINNLGVLLQNTGNLDGAEALLVKSLDVRLNVDEPNQILIGAAYNNLAFLHQLQERYDDAKGEYGIALEIFRSELREDHPNVGTILRNLASLSLLNGDIEGAEKSIKQAIEIFDKAYIHWKTADAESILGAVLAEQEKTQEACKLIESSFATLRERKGTSARQTKEAQMRLQDLCS